MTKKIFLLLALILLTATTNVEAAENDSPFDILTSTYTEGANEILALVKAKDNGSLGFAMLDISAKSIAFVNYSRELYDFYSKENPIVFGLMLPDQKRGELDDNLGLWKENFHIMPVYAAFKVTNGQVICQKPFHSASSPQAASYQEEIKNPMHVRLIETLLTHMPRLHEQVQAKGITLP